MYCFSWSPEGLFTEICSALYEGGGWRAYSKGTKRRRSYVKADGLGYLQRDKKPLHKIKTATEHYKEVIKRKGVTPPVKYPVHTIKFQTSLANQFFIKTPPVKLSSPYKGVKQEIMAEGSCGFAKSWFII